MLDTLLPRYPRVPRRAVRIRLLTLLALGTGCADLTGPDRGDPAQYQFDQPVHYSCDRWNPGIPLVPLGLFDVYWGVRSIHEADDGPSEEQVQRVLRAGGTIVYKYHVTMMRAILSPGAVAALGAPVVRGVMDARSYKTPISIEFRSQIDLHLIEAYGGTVTYVAYYSPFVSAIVPDAAIPALRREPTVKSVQSGAGTFCLLD